MNARLIAFSLVLGLTQAAQPQPRTPAPGTPEGVDAFVLAEMTSTRTATKERQMATYRLGPRDF